MGERKNGDPSSGGWLRWSTWTKRGGILLLLLLLAVGIRVTDSSPPSPEELDYGAFLEAVEEGQVSEVKFEGDVAYGELDEPDSSEEVEEAETVRVAIPESAEPGLADRLIDQGVTVKATTSRGSSDRTWSERFFVFLVLGTIGLAAYWLLLTPRKAREAEKSVGKRPTTGFADVAGAASAKDALNDIVEFLEDPERFARLGGSMPRGVLLSGEPGTGKTLLARAVAGEANASFFQMSGSAFVDTYVGRGAARVRELFESARKQAPAIVVIDEIDAVGKTRGGGAQPGNDEREQTLNQLLVEMDGFSGAQGIVVIGATNRPDVLDRALLRPGRFDRHVVVGRPDLAEREAILSLHARQVPLAPTVELRQVARGTSGMSGADLAGLVNAAALRAAKREAREVEPIDFEEARDRILMGSPRENRILTDDERRLTAYHEAGHALVPFLLPGLDPVHKVTILPRDQALGVTASLPERDRNTHSLEELEGRIVMLMAGRAAEELIVGPRGVTTGAQNDIARATDVAEQMVSIFGMSSRIGLMAVGRASDDHTSRQVSEQTAREVDEEVRTLIESSYERARKILEANREALDAVAEALLDRETLTRADIQRVMPTTLVDVPAEPHSSAA